MTDTTWERQATIRKLDNDRQLAFGWLSVTVDKAGNPIVDGEDDIIATEDLEQAAYEYMLVARAAGDSHQATEGIGRAVESFVVTDEKIAALSIDPATGEQDTALFKAMSDRLPRGWWIGFKVEDADVWEKVKAQEYTSFSIGGVGRREDA